MVSEFQPLSSEKLKLSSNRNESWKTLWTFALLVPAASCWPCRKGSVAFYLPWHKEFIIQETAG